jgi:hypothetical protein
MRRKGEIEFVEESGLLILVKRITRVQSKERTKRTMISLAVWRLRMEDHGGKGLDVRGPLERNLAMKGIKKDLFKRGVKERGLIDRGNTETSRIMMNLGTASMTQR